MKRIILILSFFLTSTTALFAQATADQYLAAGNQLYAAKNYPQAIQYYQASVQLNPNSAAAYQGLGNCYYLQGQKDQALDNYQKALNLDPTNASLASFVQALKAQGVTGTQASPAASTAAANPTSSSPAGPAKQLEIDPFGALAYGTSTGYGIGFGGGISGGLKLDPSFSILATVAYLTFGYTPPSGPVSGVSESSASLEILGGVKYRFGDSPTKFYVLGSVGISDYMFSQSEGGQSGTGSQMYPMIEFGGGVEFPMGTDMNLFVQAQYGMILGNGGTFAYIPAEVGLNFNL
jgi:hypothetical protein